MNDIISFNSPFLQMLEDKQSRTTVYSLLMHNFCTISDLTMDKPWTNHGTTYLGRGTAYLERGQRYQTFLLISFFMLQQTFGSRHPKKVNNLGFNLDTLDGTRIQNHTVLRLLYPWSLFGSFVVHLSL